jgi:hypothetical protein
MPTYLLTVQDDDFRYGDFEPQLRLGRFQREPVLHSLAPGRRIQLRRPDGTRQSTTLENILVDGLKTVAYSDADDATLYTFPTDPTVRLVFRLRITETLAPPGTEIWLVD